MSAPTLYWPWWPITFTTGLTVILLHLHRRAVDNRRPSPVRAGVVAGAALLAILPVAAVVAMQDLSCSVTGFTQRGDSDWRLVAVLVLVFLAALGPVALGVGEPGGRAWRLAGLTSGVLVLAAMVEGVLSFAALNLYCDGSPGVLYAQVGLAIAVPAVLLGRALWSTSSPVGRSAVAGAAVLLLPPQVALVVARADDGPLACVTTGALDAAARDAVDIRGPDTDLELAAADVDGDGSVDLVGVDTTGGLRVLGNDGRGGLSPDAGTALTSGFHGVGPLATGDFDGDAQTDVVVTGVESARPPSGRSRLGTVALVMKDGSSSGPSRRSSSRRTMCRGTSPSATSTGTPTPTSSCSTGRPRSCCETRTGGSSQAPA